MDDRTPVSTIRGQGHAVENGGTAGDVRDYPFRVLLVVLSEERRENVIESLLACSPPIRTQVWIATLNDLLADPLGAVWVRPMDHSAVAGSGENLRRALLAP